MRKKAARAEHAAQVSDHEDEEGGDDGQVKVLALAEALEDLDALLEVDEGDVEAENVAGEAGDVAKKVAGVCDSEDPVEDEGPSGGVSLGSGGGGGWVATIVTYIPIQHMKAM